MLPVWILQWFSLECHGVIFGGKGKKKQDFFFFFFLFHGEKIKEEKTGKKNVRDISLLLLCIPSDYSNSHNKQQHDNVIKFKAIFCPVTPSITLVELHPVLWHHFSHICSLYSSVQRAFDNVQNSILLQLFIVIWWMGNYQKSPPAPPFVFYKVKDAAVYRIWL